MCRKGASENIIGLNDRILGSGPKKQAEHTTPGRGYSAQREVGQVEQIALPEFGEAPAVKRLKTKARQEKSRN